MADDIQGRPAEESKKDTVRINLPPGLAGRGAPPTGPTPPPGSKIIPTPAPAAASPEEEAKKETAVLGRPVDAPKPKKDTSRVQVVAARPGPVGGVKLRRDEPAPAAAIASATASTPSAPAPSPMMMAAPASTGGDSGLAIAAMVLSIAVAGYLAWIAFG